MMKTHLLVISLCLSLSSNFVQASCDNCLTKSDLIEMSATDIVDKMQKMSTLPENDIHNNSQGWEQQIPNWERAFTSDKVQAVTNLLRQSYTTGGSIQLQRAALPLKYLAAMNYTYHTLTQSDSTVSDEFAATHLKMSDSVSTVLTNLFNQEALLITEYDQSSIVQVAINEALRLVESPDPRLNVSRITTLESVFKYAEAAVLEPFTNLDGSARLNQVTIATNILALYYKAGQYHQLQLIPQLDVRLAKIGTTVSSYSSSVSKLPFFTPMSVNKIGTGVLNGIGVAAFLSDNPSVYDKYLGSLPEFGDTHLYMSTFADVNSIDCKKIRPINICPEYVSQKLRTLPVSSFKRDNVTIVGNIPQSYADHLFDQLHTVKSAFTSTFGYLDPVPGDTNDQLKIVLYSSSGEYKAYQHLVNNLPGDNGGIYIEKDNTIYTYIHGQDDLDGTTNFHTEELVRHEYVHWLVARYLVPGSFGESKLYEDGAFTSIDEGLANYFAGATNHHGVYPVSTMVNRFGWNPSSYSIKDDLSLTYSDEGLYERSAMAMSYMASIGGLNTLKTILRSEDLLALQQWKKGDTASYRQYTQTLITGNKSVRWETPFNNRLHVNSAVDYKELSELVQMFTSIGASDVNCQLINDTRYTCQLLPGSSFDSRLRELSNTSLTVKLTSCAHIDNNKRQCVGPVRKNGVQFNQYPYHVVVNKPVEVKPNETLSVTLTLNVNEHYYDNYTIIDVGSVDHLMPLSINHSGNTVHVTSVGKWAGGSDTNITLQYSVIDETGFLSKQIQTVSVPLKAAPITPPSTDSGNSSGGEKSGGVFGWSLMLAILLLRRKNG